jgi:hypothetical protein
MSEARRVRYTIRIENSDPLGLGEPLDAEIRSVEIECPKGGTLERHYAVIPLHEESIAIWPRDLEAILHACALKDHKYVPPTMYDDDDPCVE